MSFGDADHWICIPHRVFFPCQSKLMHGTNLDIRRQGSLDAGLQQGCKGGLSTIDGMGEWRLVYNRG